MTTATILHDHVADRVADTEEAMEAAAEDPLGPEIAEHVLEWLRSAAAADGVTREEARAAAKQITADAYEAFLLSSTARAIAAAAGKTIARGEKAGLHGGISRREARQVGRIERAHVEERRRLRRAAGGASSDSGGGT